MRRAERRVREAGRGVDGILWGRFWPVELGEWSYPNPSDHGPASVLPGLTREQQAGFLHMRLPGRQYLDSSFLLVKMDQSLIV
jgi:hypothetical protein